MSDAQFSGNTAPVNSWQHRLPSNDMPFVLGGGQYGTEPLWYRPIMVQTRYLAMLNYIFGTTMKSSVKWCQIQQDWLKIRRARIKKKL